MKVSTRNTGDLEAIMTVNIEKDDYQEKVDKVLKDYRRKADMPGFRKGHVPFGLIKKQYGKSVLIEEINSILQRAIFDHIQEEKMDILGNPLPVEQNDIDWDAQTEFSFDYELGLSPEFDLKITDKTKVVYYNIKADESMIDRYVDDYAKRFGKMTHPEKVEENALMQVEFVEVDKSAKPVEGGITKTSSLSLSSVETKSQALFLDKVKGDKVLINAKKAFIKDFNLANVLGVDKEQLDNSTMQFELVIAEVSRLDPAEINQELFDKVFGEGELKSEEEFRNRIAEDAERVFVGQSDRQFYQDVKKTLLGKMKFDLPDTFLKKWVEVSAEQPITAEEVEEKFPEMKDDMRWQLIENKVLKENNIQIKPEEILNYTKTIVSGQMAQYGQSPEDAELESIAKNVLSNKEEEQRISEQLYSEKLLEFFKGSLKLDKKEVNFDQFLKKVSA